MAGALMANSTPGPWRYVRPTLGSPFAYVEAEIDGRNVTELNDNRHEYEANGHLIATTPELLDFVRRCLFAGPGGLEQLRAEAGALLLKAEGREP
jgi:hypothetical protein